MPRFLAVFLLLSGCLPAAMIPEAKPESVGLSTERLAQIRETIQRHMDAQEISGAVTLVARQGRVAHLEAHGSMDVEGKRAMEKNAVFRIWSMTKPVVGVAILMLLEEGKVRLNDPVSRFIPEFKTMKVAVAQEKPGTYYTVPATREITIQDLLTHVSGLGSGPLSAPEMTKLPKQPTDTLADYVPRMASPPLDFQPGSRWTYSPGAAFDTLGRVVEVASGQSFEKFLAARVFGPLGMKETTFHPAGDVLARLVKSYHRTPGALTPLDPKHVMLNLYGDNYSSGAGGLYSTAADYALFAQMLLDGGQLHGKRLLSPRTVELMASIFVPDTMPGRPPGRGFGLSVQVISDPIAAGQRVSKGSYGWDGAFGTHFWIDPKEKVVGIMMIQTDNSNRQLDRDFENAVMQAIVE
ncbi:MAG: beta-lactamase family protein [Bryobacteraceae bacterium]|nr:beta-lactamase family protein [Bryobacteraceae bacterium]